MQVKDGNDSTWFGQAYGEHTLVLLRHGELAPRSFLTFTSLMLSGTASSASRSEWNLQNRFTGGCSVASPKTPLQFNCQMSQMVVSHLDKFVWDGLYVTLARQAGLMWTCPPRVLRRPLTRANCCMRPMSAPASVEEISQSAAYRTHMLKV